LEIKGKAVPTKDPRIDAYIAKSADFAKPILKRLRALVHKGCPDVVEMVKWGMPSFEYPPKSILCGFAAFKQHAVFGFWKSAILFGDGKEAREVREKLNWGAPGRDPVPARLTSIGDLPSDAVMIRLVKQAAALNEQGVKLPAKPKTKKPPPRAPADLAAALRKAKGAAAKFKAFSPSHQREYIEWITEAKADETRSRRIAQAVEWIAEGKSRNWKYERKK
jgi:uncharacterized protein YdeI (YjbR/CyaY-like superfamily)